MSETDTISEPTAYQAHQRHVELNVGIVIGNSVSTSIEGDTMRAITADEVKQLIKACKPTDLQGRAFVDLAYHSGLRPAEMCELQWADVDLAARRVRVRHGKGDRSRVSAIAETFGYLELWRGQSGGQGYVFKTRAGKPWQTSHVRRLFTRLSELTGVDASPHCLRHAHAHSVWAETKDLGLVSAQLGHQRLSTTDEYLKQRGVELDAVAALTF